MSLSRGVASWRCGGASAFIFVRGMVLAVEAVWIYLINRPWRRLLFQREAAEHDWMSFCLDEFDETMKRKGS